MIILKDLEKRFPTSWEYNAARVMSHVATIAENNGARVKYGPRAVLQNRSINKKIREYTERIERVKNPLLPIDAEKQARVIAMLETERAEWENMNNDPITVTHTSYISFVLDDVYYYFQIDKNPFFPFYYQKTPVMNGKIYRCACLEESKKEWLFDCMFDARCNNAEVVEIANLIYNELINAKYSTIIRNSRRERVPNMYDGGYHYETVYEKETFNSIDF